ncbi:hypothetical protein KKA17_01955 [bacterium]|nr:hypothetical protein [bacterium]MBU1882745.1 hypothetical protein [bacterium]
MKIATKYSYEKIWQETKEEDLLRMLKEEVGEEAAEGTLVYVKDACKQDKTITVGSLKFKKL